MCEGVVNAGCIRFYPSHPHFLHPSLKNFNQVILVRVDADIAGDGQRSFDDVLRWQFGILEQRSGGRLGVGAAAADCHQPQFRFDNVAVAGDDQRGFVVCHRQHRFEPAQHAVGAPVLGEFHGGTEQVALMLFQLRLEALEQSERVRRTAGETGEDALVEKTPDLARAGLENDIAESHLSVAAEGDATATAHRHDRCTVNVVTHKYVGRKVGRWLRERPLYLPIRAAFSSTLNRRNSVVTRLLACRTRTVLPLPFSAAMTLARFPAHTKSMRCSLAMLMFTYWRSEANRCSACRCGSFRPVISPVILISSGR